MKYPEFPKGFIFGSATAAYQIEGAFQEDGKGPSIWDHFSHTPGKIKTGENADTACDFYHRYREDIGLMKVLGMHAFRGSISWPRVLPEGEGRVNEKGLDFYEQLTDALLEAGITPFYTLYHWDMPLALWKKYRGFESREAAQLFADYTGIVVKRLGDRVKHWITLNEPWEHAAFGYLLGIHAPGRKKLRSFFKVIHNQLLAHGEAVKRIREVSPDGKVGITLCYTPVHPRSSCEKDKKAAFLANQFLNSTTFDPVLKGRNPQPLWKKALLFRPEVRPGDMELISAPIDFVGINNYSRDFASWDWKVPIIHADIGGRNLVEGREIEGDYEINGVRYTSMGWEVYPEGLHEVLTIMKDEYGNPPIYITENGAAFEDTLTKARVHDEHRVNFLKGYLNQVSIAIREGADIRGYFVWSLIDNFEWAEGFRKRFGIVYVDHETQDRVIKDSGYWYRELIKNNLG
ncbi:MAG: beta-glucosidase [Spirochaetales bacterium]|jgi:beta-glucosidase|nr:beta-glucosidase [Spirochaetales bacterium]